MLVKHKKHFFETFQDGQWTALREVKVTEAEDALRHRRVGKKITMAQVRQIHSFFEWAYEETGGETMVHGYYHPAHGWEFLVLPQEGHKGLAVSLIDDPEWRREALIAKLPGVWDGKSEWKEEYNESWECLMTWHHHCNSSAFASGTDTKDETTKVGLHLTTGHIGSNRYSLHARTSYGQLISEAVLSDWFEVDPVIEAAVPPHLHDDIIEHAITTPPTERDFPLWWMDNVKKKAPAPIVHHASYPAHNGLQYTPVRTSAAWSMDNDGGYGATSCRSYEWFRDKVTAYAEAKGIKLEDLQLAIAAMPSHLVDLVDLMASSEITVMEAAYLLEEAEKERAAEIALDNQEEAMWGRMP